MEEGKEGGKKRGGREGGRIMKCFPLCRREVITTAMTEKSASHVTSTENTWKGKCDEGEAERGRERISAENCTTEQEGRRGGGRGSGRENGGKEKTTCTRNGIERCTIRERETETTRMNTPESRTLIDGDSCSNPPFFFYCSLS